MTRYNYKYSVPKEDGFYKVFCDGSGPFVSMYSCMAHGFLVGPYIGGATMIHEKMTNERVTEWEIWK